MSKKLIPAILDGVVCSITLQILSEFVISIYSKNLSLYQCLLLSTIISMVCAIIYVSSVSKEAKNKTLVVLSLISVLSFVLFTIAIIVCCLIFPNYNYFPLREENNGDAILLMFSMGAFILFSIFTRLVVLIVCIIKNNTRDGSVS
ncbi:MAG: hypothetical protein J6B52_06135 [Clostridia bacterium]|nr:hypothetical protein [Clostridia bacterium]